MAHHTWNPSRYTRDESYENCTVVNQVLYSMHAHTRPWVGIEGLVMKLMNVFIQEGGVQEPVSDVEVKVSPDSNENQPSNSLKSR